jgi:hypothetical protein
MRLKLPDSPVRTIESAYAASIREKAIRSQQKHSWKSGSGELSPFSGPALWGKAAVGSDVPLAITSICGGRTPGELIYSLESGSLCALLQMPSELEELRLWNDNRTRIRHISVSREAGHMVFSVLHENGTANIGLKRNGEGGISELTEGDSFDTAPRWRPGNGERIVFQSAGIGRNREGHFLALGPFSIQELDLETGEMTTLLEEHGYDYLAPQVTEHGGIYYIRRPHAEYERIRPMQALKDFALFPLRLMYAIFQFLNVFSAIFTGRKLTSAGGAKAREMDLRQMMIWGNVVRSERASRPEEEGLDLVPKSWQLYRRGSTGEPHLLASGVLAYDVDDRGCIVYTNGNAVFLLHPDGRKEHVLNERMIEQVFFVPA